MGGGAGENDTFKQRTSVNIRTKPLNELVAFVERTAAQLQDILRSKGESGTLTKRRNDAVTRRVAERRASLVLAAKEELESRNRASTASSAQSASRNSRARSSSARSRRPSLLPTRNEDIWSVIGNFFKRRGKQRESLKRSESSYDFPLTTSSSEDEFESGLRGQPKYATLRPTRKIDGQGRLGAGEHSGSVQLTGPIFVQGVRINSWHKCWFNLWHTGIELYSTRSDCRAQTNGFQDIYFQDLVLPTGKVVDVLPKAHWGLENRYPFCLNTEAETFVLATTSQERLNEYIEAIDLAYAEHLERQIRKRVMMQITWQLSENPAQFIRAQTDTENASTDRPRRSRAGRESARRAPRQSQARRQKKGHQPLQPREVDDEKALSVFDEMLGALQERYLVEMNKIRDRRRLATAFLGWRAVKAYRCRAMPGSLPPKPARPIKPVRPLRRSAAPTKGKGKGK